MQKNTLVTCTIQPVTYIIDTQDFENSCGRLENEAKKICKQG